MSKNYKKMLPPREMPKNFCEVSVKTIKRIAENNNVLGIMYFNNDHPEMSTVPTSMVHTLSINIPQMKAAMHRALTEITASINNVNPIVDRIMEDESVEGVILANKEGCPILTNMNIMNATNYGFALQRLGVMTQFFIKELDTFDEVIALRLNTKKIELMTTPHSEFNIIVVQHARQKLSKIKLNKP